MFGKNKTKTIIIAGCGRLGAGISGALSRQGYNVIIIDQDEASFRKLPDGFSGHELSGDATDLDVLEKAGIKSAHMLLALTESDSVNSLIAQIASRIFHLPKVYMRLNEPEKEAMLKGFNIEVIEPFRLSLLEFERLSQLNITGVQS